MALDVGQPRLPLSPCSACALVRPSAGEVVSVLELVVLLQDGMHLAGDVEREHPTAVVK